MCDSIMKSDSQRERGEGMKELFVREYKEKERIYRGRKRKGDRDRDVKRICN